MASKEHKRKIYSFLRSQKRLHNNRHGQPNDTDRYPKTQNANVIKYSKCSSYSTLYSKCPPLTHAYIETLDKAERALSFIYSRDIIRESLEGRISKCINTVQWIFGHVPSYNVHRCVEIFIWPIESWARWKK